MDPEKICSDGARNPQPVCFTSVVLFWVMIAMNACLFISCCTIMYYALRTEKQWKVTKFVKVLIPLLPTFRLINMAIIGKYFFVQDGRYAANQNMWAIVTGGITGYIFISIYSLLVIFWFLLYNMANTERYRIVQTMKRTAIGLNVLMYGIWLTLIILMATLNEKKEEIHTVEACYAASLDIIVAVAFLLFGGRLHFQLTRMSIISPESLKIGRKVGALTIICAVVFSARSILLFLDVFYFSTAIEFIASTICFNLLCETFPTVLIMFILSAEYFQAFSFPRAQETEESEQLVNTLSSELSSFSSH
mmetsp:Transcript_29403/g.40623  ORF Transcript_29403/g.40623 Transcript_29403/m.40623 type:complete len:306 (-) Transcript_29403:251-1168(-)